MQSMTSILQNMGTSTIRVSDKVLFKHQYITIPEVSKANAIVAAATQLIKVLQDELLKNISETNKEQQAHLASIFHTTTNRWTGRQTKTNQSEQEQQRVEDAEQQK